MTYDPSHTRRRLLQSTAISASSFPIGEGFNRGAIDQQIDDTDLPETDFIDDYLGVTSFSYDDPEGELWNRMVIEEPDCPEDCVYSIRQRIAIQDADYQAVVLEGGDKGPLTFPSPIVCGDFELQLTCSNAEQIPSFYYKIESQLDDDLIESSEAWSFSEFSIESYPGLLLHYDKSVKDDLADDMNLVQYVQSFPWGLLHWDLAYEPNSKFELDFDLHHEWLRKRKHRDWDIPSLVTKSHWQDIHHGDLSEKSRYRGDMSTISSILPELAEAELENTDQPLSATSDTDQPAAVELNAYR